MKERIKKILGIKKKYYWYDCQFFYKRKGEDRYCIDFNSQIGLVKQKDIINHRVVTKTVGDRFSTLPKRILNNGVFYYKKNSYLGKFEYENTRNNNK